MSGTRAYNSHSLRPILSPNDLYGVVEAGTLTISLRPSGPLMTCYNWQVALRWSVTLCCVCPVISLGAALSKLLRWCGGVCVCGGGGGGGGGVETGNLVVFPSGGPLQLLACDTLEGGWVVHRQSIGNELFEGVVGSGSVEGVDFELVLLILVGQWPGK